MAIFLAVDLGTTGCRSILFNESLELIGSSYQEYGLITPQPNYVEQDAELWWQLTLKTAKEAITKSKTDAKDIRSISISSQGITIVPVDKNYKPLCNAISWLDSRCDAELEQIRKFYSDSEITENTGKPLHTYYTLPKIMWLQNHKPELVQNAYKLLMPLEFLTARFTGRAVTDHSMACGTMFYDVNNQCWWQEVLERFNIDPQKLPELAWGGEAVGTVLPEVAAELGLSNDCIVALGAQDQKCAALAAGLDRDTVTVSLGTAGAISKLNYKTDVKRGKCSYIMPGAWVTEGVINTAGTCLRYIRDLFYKDEPYSLIDQEAEQALKNNSTVMFYPYMSGPSDPDHYPDSTGCFYGINLASKRGDYALAVMEGIAYQIRIILEAMGNYQSVDEMVVFGGASKSDLWSQIIADITGITVCVPSTSEAAGAGAAILAAKGAGIELSPLKITKKYTPKTDCNAKYALYRAVEKKLFAED